METKPRKKLRARMSLYGYTVTELAKEIGISKSALSNIINGKTERVDPKIISKAAENLNCQAKDIISGPDLHRYQRQTKTEVNK